MPYQRADVQPPTRHQRKEANLNDNQQRHFDDNVTQADDSTSTAPKHTQSTVTASRILLITQYPIEAIATQTNKANSIPFQFKNRHYRERQHHHRGNKQIAQQGSGQHLRV